MEFRVRGLKMRVNISDRRVQILDLRATALEVTQGQISSQSPTDAA